MSKTILVSSCNDKYLFMLIEMLESLKGELEKYDLGIFDLGLSDASKDKIRALKPSAIIKAPEWYIDLPEKYKASVQNYAFASRPFMPRIFPGYEAYMQIDADLWFCDPKAVEDYIAAGEKTGMAIAVEAHPLLTVHHRIRHSKIFGKTIVRGFKVNLFSRFKRHFGTSAAVQYGLKPVFNAGLIYIKADHPVWKFWQEITANLNFKKILGKKRFICDETCLNYALLRHGLDFTMMGVNYNWFISPTGCNLPLFDSETKRLVDPMYDHAPVHALHYRGNLAHKIYDLKTTDGRVIKTNLMYSSIAALQA